ncbi:unnamed protein product [Calicophoron daubneyi]|uniref:6-phosphogluconolactonase n=1 Tax=Calicophoron daubneyi TaxID=300641 RepID=A0AAV2TUX9_CALDB
MPSQICPSLRGFQDVRWDLIHFFYCDERLVPLTHKDSTHRLYEDLLYSKINIPRDNIHIVDTSLPANVAAGDYADKMFSFFSPSDGFPCFDLLLLGIGPDGHTCSLFPDHALLHVTDVCVAPIMDSPKPPPQRVTLTLPVLNKAKRVVFIASGIGKSEVIHI